MSKKHSAKTYKNAPTAFVLELDRVGIRTVVCRTERSEAHLGELLQGVVHGVRQATSLPTLYPWTLKIRSVLPLLCQHEQQVWQQLLCPSNNGTGCRLCFEGLTSTLRRCCTRYHSIEGTTHAQTIFGFPSYTPRHRPDAPASLPSEQGTSAHLPRRLPPRYSRAC